ncbi:hypothetical protein M9H77_06161 [Catharanthus roseus]|uniref:Uncharacterized protein n=1 Tax=Catharanthus roseus TaxID=4058 RepID=A0ACC0BR94_CATRO|nr:hypothetical protein M9H77_06161 [Catharanthus roseus]
MEPISNIKKTYVMIIKEESHRKLVRNAEIRSEAVVLVTPKSGQNSIHCAYCFKQSHEARNYYLLVGYLKRWSERSQETSAGGRKERGRTNRGRGRCGSRNGYGFSILGSSPTGSGWAVVATVQQGKLCAPESDARLSAAKQSETASATASNSTIRILGLSTEQCASFVNLLNSH